MGKITVKKRVAWNKGKGKGWVDKRGYCWVSIQQDGRYRAIRKHRLVMEQHLDRKLESWEIVHHKDGNSKNNNISNLELTSYSTHTLSHHIGKKRPEATKKAMAVFAQLREEIHHLRRVRNKLQNQKTNLLDVLMIAPVKMAGETLEQFYNAYESWLRTDRHAAITKAQQADEPERTG